MLSQESILLSKSWYTTIEPLKIWRKRNATCKVWHRMMIIGRPTSWFANKDASCILPCIFVTIILWCGSYGFFHMHSPHELHGVSCCAFHIVAHFIHMTCHTNDTHTHTQKQTGESVAANRNLKLLLLLYLIWNSRTFTSNTLSTSIFVQSRANHCVFSMFPHPSSFDVLLKTPEVWDLTGCSKTTTP